MNPIQRFPRQITPQEPIYYGALVRFRPIMTTTVASLMGTLPFTPGFGAGAEARRPLGLCVVGRLEFITLYVPPPSLDAFRKWMQRLLGSKEPLALNGEHGEGTRT